MSLIWQHLFANVFAYSFISGRQHFGFVDVVNTKGLDNLIKGGRERHILERVEVEPLYRTETNLSFYKMPNADLGHDGDRHGFDDLFD